MKRQGRPEEQLADQSKPLRPVRWLLLENWQDALAAEANGLAARKLNRRLLNDSPNGCA
jgi:hypothetical protein